MIVAVRWLACSLAAPAIFAGAADLSNGLPLKPTRTVEFTTTQGTWMNLDVSPDGKTIVFDLLGDLYALPISGGSARRLTEGMALDQRPRFAPDGRGIVFTTDRGGYARLWRMDIDGGNIRELSWTERERQFKDVPLGIEATSIAHDTAAFDLTSPDGRYRITADRAPQTWPCRLNMTLLLQENPGGGARKWLEAPFDCGRGVAPAAAFTPDSRALIAAFGGNIWRVDVPSGKRSRIPFKARVRQHLGPLLSFEQRLPELGQATYRAKQIRDVRPSPDGRWLVFVAFDRLWVVERPSGAVRAGRPRRVTTDEVSEHWPVWSPDGRSLSYVTWTDNDGGRGDIRRVPMSNGASTQTPQVLTTEPGYYDRLNRTPDGTKLVAVWRPLRHLRERSTFVTNDLAAKPGAEYVWLPADGGGMTSIVPAAPEVNFASNYRPVVQMRYGWPHFSADPRRLLRFQAGDWGLSEEDKTANELLSVDMSGHGKQALLRLEVQPPPGENDIPLLSLGLINEVLLSPAGTHAAVLSNQHTLHLVTLPASSAARTEPPVFPLGLKDSPTVKRITPVDAGGAFASWRADGRAIYYAFGSSFFEYDLQRGTTARTDIDVSVPREIGRGVVVLRGARLITMRGDEVIEDGAIVIRDDRIVAVGAAARVPVPPGAAVIDVNGTTILPGYIDLHDHIVHNGTVHRTRSWQLLANLAYGVTTARDPQMLTDDALSYEDVSRAGRMIGARYFNTGPGIACPSGDWIESLEDARAVLGRYRHYYRSLNWKEYISGNRHARQWLAMASREHGMNTVVHNQGGVLQPLTMILDGYTEVDHPFSVFPLYRDVIQLFSRSGAVIANTGGDSFRPGYLARLSTPQRARLARFISPAYLTDMERRYSKESADEQSVSKRLPEIAVALAAAGGRIGIGQHGEAPGIGTHMEMWALVDAGMPPLEALRAGTRIGAQAIGLESELGSLEAGKVADLQILEHNPLRDIGNTLRIRYVMRDGRLFDAATMDEI